MSEEKNHLYYLISPLYYLYYIDDIYDENIYKEINIEFMQGEEQTDEPIYKILLSLEWAKNNPNYNFKSILAKLGSGRAQGEYTNDDIYFFLNRMYDLVNKYLNKDK